MTPSRREGMEGVVRRLRRDLARRAALAAAVWSGTAICAVLLAAWAAGGAAGWAQGTLLPLALDSVLLATIAGMAGAAVWMRRRWLTERRVARAMEDAARVPRGSVLGSLELARHLPPGVSGALAAHGERGVLQALLASGSDLSGPLGVRTARWLRQGTRALAVAAPLLLLTAALSPERAARSWQGLATPLRWLAEPSLPPLQVEPGNVEVERGTRVEVRVLAGERRTLTLRWQSVGEGARERELARGADGTFRARLPGATAALDYEVSAADGARSPRFRVTPVDPLLLSEVTLELRPPPHTGRSPERVRADVGALSLPAGTRLRVRGSASGPIGSAALVPLEEGPPVVLDVEGRTLEGEWVPRRSGTWLWDVRGTDGDEAGVAPPPLELTLLPDSVPLLSVSHPGQDTALPLSLRQPLVVEVRDDYGLERLELSAYRVRGGERGEPLTVASALEGARAVIARPVLDVSTWGLLPGDTVRYRLRVVDNAPRGQTAESPEYALWMPGPSALRRDTQEALAEATRRLEALAEAAGRAAEEARELERSRSGESASRGSPSAASGRTSASQPMAFGEREELEAALERQEGMVGAVDSLASELSRMRRALEESGLMDPGLRRDLDELRELLGELASPELRERLEALRRGLDEGDLRRAREGLGELARDEGELRRRLEESLERFRRAVAEQDLRATTEEARELARQEEALADAFREGDDPEGRAAQQDRLRERSGELAERIESLAERLEGTGDRQARQRAQDAARGSRQAREAMSRAAAQARAGEPQGAADAADEAARELDEAARELERAQEEMERRLEEAVRRALRETATGALALARGQSELRERLRGADPRALQELRGDEAALLQGARALADRFVETAPPGAGSVREIAARLGAALQAIQRTVDSMGEGSGPSPSAAAEGAVGALNEVALAALEAAEAVGSQPQGDAAEALRRELESLAAQQSRLNQQTGALVPMQLGEQALSQQLQSISQGQQAVAGELGRLSARQEAGGGALGDVEALSEEARELAERLSRGRLDPETRQRQERLFHRLLDAGRSLEKDEESREREARAPEGFERAPVAPIPADALGILPFALPDALQLRALPPAQRQMVVEYFERLNRRAPAGGGPEGGSSAPPGGGRP